MQSAKIRLPPLPACPTYFEESYNPIVEAAHARQRAKEFAKQRQLTLAAELSDITSAEYRDDILRQMEVMEAVTLPDAASIELQAEIQWFMRPYLLDFLIEAHAAFQLLPETLDLCVNLLDRYCSRRVVYKRHYQLVGCAALLAAAKYGDNKNKVPTVKELKSMCCSLYDEGMFTAMEWHLLLTLDWAIGHPTVDSFLQLALAEEAHDPEVEHMASYISQMAMYHKEFIGTPPSAMARSALALAKLILGRPPLPLTSYWAPTDSFLIMKLSRQITRPSPILVRKFAHKDYLAVSMILDDFLARQASIAKTYTPPTPPRDVTMSDEDTADLRQYTPQKRQCHLGAPNGYVTPPITPVGGYAAFNPGNCKNIFAVPSNGYPPSPSPLRIAQQAPHWYRYQGGGF